MPVYYFDTSALVKRYVQESGTRWVRSLTHRNTSNVIYLAQLTSVEVTAAVARRRKGRTLTTPKASSILFRFRKHFAGRYTVVAVTPSLLDAATKLANTHALRGYDAVQLAVALEIRRRHLDAGLGLVTLVSSDRELNDAASAEGMTVEDPKAHP